MKKLISNDFTNFYKKWLSFLVLIVGLVIISFMPYMSLRMPLFVSVLLFSTLLFVFVSYSFLTMHNLCKVRLDEDYLYVDDFKKEEIVPIKNINKAWQSFGFYTRLINVSYQVNEEETRNIKFIGHFEVNLGKKHHTIITEINNRVAEK